MKNKSAILLLFLANTISGIAQGISMLAIPWHFAEQGEMGRFGWVFALTTMLSMFWVPYSGALIDKYNRKYVFLTLTAVCGMIISIIAALGFYWGMLPWYLVAAVFTTTFLNYNVHYPCLYSFVQEISEERHYGRMTAFLEIQGQLSTMLAGAAGALLLEGTKNGVINVFGFQVNIGFDVAAWKIQDIFLLDAGTYFAGFLIILLIRYQPIAQRYIEEGNVWAQVKIGANYLKKNWLIFVFGMASYSIFVTVLLEGFWLGAQYAKAHLQADASVYAASAMYYSLGALFAGAAVQQIFKKMSVPKAIIIMTMITAILYFVLAATTIHLVYYSMIFTLGLTNAGTRVMRVTYLFNHIPNQVYGRANSIFFLGNISFRLFFIMMFSIPFFQIGNHVIYTFVILGIFLLLSAWVLWHYAPQIAEE